MKLSELYVCVSKRKSHTKVSKKEYNIRAKIAVENLTKKRKKINDAAKYIKKTKAIQNKIEETIPEDYQWLRYA